MENPQDDPREFHQHDGGADAIPQGIEPFLCESILLLPVHED
jgi:hypothetical protein